MDLPNLKCVIFDFDFTLGDSSRGIIECVNYALREMGFPQVSGDAVRPLIGMSLPETFTRLTGDSNPRRIETFRSLFVQQADEVMADQTEVYEAVPQVISELRRLGTVLAIVSTKYRYRLQHILTRCNLLREFEVIVGGEDVTAHKPDPAGLLRVLDILKVSPLQAIYVGDHPVDARAAEAAGIPFVWLRNAFQNPRDFDDLPRLAILEQLTALPGLVERHRRH